jgi:hypothetical protein
MCHRHRGSHLGRCGDVDLVRFFHQRGVQFWDCTWEEHIDDMPPSKFADLFMSSRLAFCRKLNILTIPRNPQDVWKALFYSSVMGAPLTPGMEEVLKAKRAPTRAVLLSLHVASRQSQGEGTEQQKAAWDAMGRIPMDITENILVLAECEIPDSLRHSLFGQEGAKIQGRVARVRWSQLEGEKFGDVWVYTPVPSNVEQAGLE